MCKGGCFFIRPGFKSTVKGEGLFLCIHTRRGNLRVYGVYVLFWLCVVVVLLLDYYYLAYDSFIIVQKSKYRPLFICLDRHQGG